MTIIVFPNNGWQVRRLLAVSIQCHPFSNQILCGLIILYLQIPTTYTDDQHLPEELRTRWTRICWRLWMGWMYTMIRSILWILTIRSIETHGIICSGYMGQILYRCTDFKTVIWPFTFCFGLIWWICFWTVNYLLLPKRMTERGSPPLVYTLNVLSIWFSTVFNNYSFIHSNDQYVFQCWGLGDDY